MLSLPDSVHNRLMKRLEQDGIALLKISRTGFRVWGYDEYQSRQEASKETINKNKPWKKRGKKSPLGPIGSKSLGKMSSTFRRTEISENE